jgi:hypothetical protein
MRFRSKLLGLAGGLATLAVMPLSTSAQSLPPTPQPLPACLTTVAPSCIPLSDVLVVAGNATTTPAVPIQGGSGTFTASSNACAYASDSDNPLTGQSIPVLAEAGQCALNAINGTYTNYVCGTGTASGSGNLSTTPVVGEVEGNGTFAFTITFYGGVGFTTGSITAGTETEPFVGVTLIEAATVPNPLTNTCTNGFSFQSVDVALEAVLGA